MSPSDHFGLRTNKFLANKSRVDMPFQTGEGQMLNLSVYVCFGVGWGSSVFGTAL